MSKLPNDKWLEVKMPSIPFMLIDPDTTSGSLKNLGAGPLAVMPKRLLDALLAVAKAAARSTANPDAPGAQAAIDAAVVALYDQHPGWREWQP